MTAPNDPAGSAGLEALAERCEAATGPDRMLDAMIHHAIKDGVGTGYAADAPAYTASLDAAMTLVPEGWKLAQLAEWIGWVMREKGAWRAALTSLTPSRSRIEVEHAATPALALTAAALKAAAALSRAGKSS